MSASEAKKAKRRKKGSHCVSLSGASPNKAALTVNWVAHENPANLQDQAISEMQKLMDAEDDLPKTVIPRGPNPYLGVEQCLLCHRIRSNPPSPEPHRKCDGTDDGSKLMSDSATLAQLPLWVCADCRHSVEDDPRKDCSDTGILASGLFLQPTPLDIISCIQQPSGSESSSSSCEACSRKRDSEQEQEATHLQADWMELHYAVWQIYRKAGVGDGCDDAGIQDADQQLSMDRVAELVNRLCIMDPHQLFQRLETQAHEAVIDSKMHLLRLLPPSAATKTPNTRAAANFVQALLEDYAKLCVACMQLCPLLRQLESEHLKKFNLTWELVNQHLFQSIVHTDPLIQKCLPALIAHLRNVAALQDSNSQDSLASTLYHRYVKFNDEMTMISAVWRREAEHYIQEYNAEQLALKAKQRMLQEDWELFRMQRKLLEQQLQKDGATLPGDCSPGFAETMQQMLSGAKALSDDCHCPHCNRNQCPCDECSISHMLTCGLITPPDTPVPGEELILTSPPQLSHEAAQFLHPALTAIVATTERVLDGAMCANGFDHKLNSSSSGNTTALPWEMDEEDDEEEEEDDDDEDDEEEEDEDEDDDDEEEEEEDDEDVQMQATELQNGVHVERSENCHTTSVRSSELQDTPASPASPSPTPEDGVSQGQGLSDGSNMIQSCECHVCTAPMNGSSLPVNMALQDNVTERPCECNPSIQHHHHGERSSLSAPTPPLRPLSLHLYPHIHGGINTSTSQLLHTPPSAALKSLIHPHLYNLHPASMMLTPSSSSVKHRNGSTPSTPTTASVVTTESDITTAGVAASVAAAGSAAAGVPPPVSLDLNPTAAVAFQEQLYRTYGDWDNAYESTKMLLNARKYAAASPNVLSTSPGHVPGAIGSADLYQSVTANVTSELPVVSSVALDAHLPPSVLRPNLNVSAVSSSSCAASNGEISNESIESSEESIKDVFHSASVENRSAGTISSSLCSVASHAADLPTHPVKGNLCAKHAHAASAASNTYPNNLVSSASSSNASPTSAALTVTAAKRSQTTTTPAIPTSRAASAKELAPLSASPPVTCCNNSNATVRLPPPSTNLSAVQHTCGLPNTTTSQTNGQQHASPPASAKQQQNVFDSLVDQHPQIPSSTASNGVCADPECDGHHGDADDSIDDSCSEQSSSTSTSNQKDSKHCDCCYCEVFGHGTPTVAPVSKNYIEMRERLRLRLTKRKSKCKNANNSSSSPAAAAPPPAPTPPVPAPPVVVPDAPAPVAVPTSVISTAASAKAASPASPVTVPQQQEPSWTQLQTVEDVDALVNFINGTEAGNREKGISNKAAKRARQKLRKAEEKARKQGDGIENTPETADDSKTVRKSKSATTLGEHKPDNQQQTLTDKQQQVKGKPRIVSLESIMEEMRKGDLAGKGTNDSILQRVIEAVKAGTAASNSGGSSGCSSDNSEPSSSSSSVSSASSSVPNECVLANTNNSKNTAACSVDDNVVNSKWELSLQSFMAAAGQAGLEIVPIPAPTAQHTSSASLKVTRNPKISTDGCSSGNIKDGNQIRSDVPSTNKNNPASKALKKKKKNGNASNIASELSDSAAAAPSVPVVASSSNKGNKTCSSPPASVAVVTPAPVTRRQPTVIIANGKASGSATLNKVTPTGVVTVTTPKLESKSKKPVVEIIPINGSVTVPPSKVNGTRGNTLTKVGGSSPTVSVIVSASSASNVSQAKTPSSVTVVTSSATSTTTSANTAASKKKKKPQPVNGQINGHNSSLLQDAPIPTSAASALPKSPAVHLVAKTPSVSLTPTSKGKDCPVTVISITSGQASKKVSATVAVKTLSSTKPSNSGTNGLPNHIRESPVSFQPLQSQQQKQSRQKSKKDEKNRAEMGNTRKDPPVSAQPQLQTTVVVQNSNKEIKGKPCSGDSDRTVCNGNSPETTVIVVGGNNSRTPNGKSCNAERPSPSAPKPVVPASTVTSNVLVPVSTTPTSTPALTLRTKKNRKKRGSLDNFNSIDEVFVPRDIDLENGDLDETERELEAFKRFCWNSIPLARKEKVHVNLKDIVIKKKSSSMVGCS